MSLGDINSVLNRHAQTAKRGHLLFLQTPSEAFGEGMAHAFARRFARTDPFPGIPHPLDDGGQQSCHVPSHIEQVL